MLAALISITVFAHLILPALFLFWIFKSKARTKAQWFSIVALVGSYLLMMWQGGAGWGWFGHYWPSLFLVLFLVCVTMSWSRRKTLPWIPEKRIKPWLGLILLGAIAGLLALGVPSTFTARSYPKEKAINLLFPLKGGIFHIGHGGSNETMNHHYPIPAQKYALDIEKLNGFGIRANGLMPTDLEKYVIFGNEVLAPCSGEVIASETSLKEMIPPEGDKENILGNHIVIFCNDMSVLLAHLKQNSVQLKKGDLVEQGKVIGQVGNTGNTSEPHLHVHAVSGRHFETKEIAGKAEGVPMVFDGEFFIRNDRVKRPY